MTFIHRRRASRRGLAIGASLAVLALAGPALAQDEAAPEVDAAGDDATAGNVITVTAQFREQNLQDTPIAITAVNAEMMDARSQTQLSEVVRQAPSVDLRPSTGAFGPSSQIGELGRRGRSWRGGRPLLSAR